MHRTGVKIRFLWALPALCLLLTACGTPAPAPAPQVPTPPLAPAVTTAPLSPTLDAAPSDAPAPQEKLPAQQQASVPPVVAEPVNDDPRQLLNLNGMRVAALLGPANFVRRDGPAEIWQYRAAQCVLDVFLYREGGGLTVAHVDLRKRDAATQPPRRCFATLIASQR